MGANSTQGTGIAVFLAGFTLLSAGIAGGGVIFDLLGLAVILAACGLFHKCKPWEGKE
jgi:hypothetical protein